ncbi:hypothetical protein ABIF20_007634 [Bradyrhizobium japonicum]
MSNPPAASARPDIISLDVMLSDIDEGRIRVPRFQRPYVWSAAMMRELFDSVLKGYPIGSLLLWAPRELKVATMGHIGPIQTPETTVTPVSLVLDGHQRLATLYGVLRLPEDHPRLESAGKDDLNWWVGYDLRSEETVQLRREEDFINPTTLPLRSVLRTADFVRFARGIDSNARLSKQEKSILLDRADKVQRAVRDYRLALTSMRDGTVDDAVAIFSRINRSGRRMTADQMAVALTYSEGFNLEDALDQLLGDLEPYGFGDVSRKTVLQGLLHAAGQSFVKPKFDDLRRADTQSSLMAALPKVSKGLIEAAKFLNDTIGFSTGKLLPYALQLLLLQIFFTTSKLSSANLSDDVKLTLRRWFWATSFEGWFASANTSEMAESVNVMEAYARLPSDAEARRGLETFFVDRPLRPFPTSFDRRSARIRALLLVQIVDGPLYDPVTKAEHDGSKLLADPERRDLPYIFPLRSGLEARSPANRILLDRKYGSSVRQFLLDHLDDERLLKQHSINQAGKQALNSNDLRGFIAAREAELERKEGLLLASLGLSVSDQTDRAEEDVDVDDE